MCRRRIKKSSTLPEANRPGSFPGRGLRAVSRIIAWLVLVALCAFASACVIPIHKHAERPIALNRALVSITKDQTTRAEVFALLGPPDIEATGANASVNPSSPLAQYYREGMRHFRTAESDWLGLLPYSSMSEDRIALLYTEFDAKVIIVISPVLGGTGSGKWNRLLIFVEKNTDRVQEIYYRQEFKRD
jgi:hypothetical protein